LWFAKPVLVRRQQKKSCASFGVKKAKQQAKKMRKTYVADLVQTNVQKYGADNNNNNNYGGIYY
jgi:hypothetical protein